MKNSTGFITNYEVLQILKEKNKGLSEIETLVSLEMKLGSIIYLKIISNFSLSQTLRYLQGTPAEHQSREGITKCLQVLGEYNITKAEKMQIINMHPQSEVEVHLV